MKDAAAQEEALEFRKTSTRDVLGAREHQPSNQDSIDVELQPGYVRRGDNHGLLAMAARRHPQPSVDPSFANFRSGAVDT